ncbi:MAG TPA: HYR domain-containing protein [Candidatus Thermoplasmatota archaeon]|nr:HYR domain-containing protein [Candidatus Thermoplasmatota archaeon]
MRAFSILLLALVLALPAQAALAALPDATVPAAPEPPTDVTFPSPIAELFAQPPFPLTVAPAFINPAAQGAAPQTFTFTVGSWFASGGTPVVAVVRIEQPAGVTLDCSNVVVPAAPVADVGTAAADFFPVCVKLYAQEALNVPAQLVFVPTLPPGTTMTVTAKATYDAATQTLAHGSSVPWKVETTGVIVNDNIVEVRTNTVASLVDREMPVTTLAVDPSSPSGAHGWYKTTPTFTLTAVDGSGDAANAGIDTISWAWTGSTVDSGTGSTPSAILDGANSIEYFARDLAAPANVETPTSSGPFLVDRVAPVFGATGDVEKEGNALGGFLGLMAPGATDATSLVDTVACDASDTTLFAVGTTTPVSCTATDMAGNTALASFNVHVVDTTAPVFDTVADITAEATSAAGAAVDFDAPVADDIVDGDIVASCDPAPGTVFPLGEPTDVTCDATDVSGNAASVTFAVDVVDTTGPVLTLPDDIVAEATSALGAVVDYDASAEDAVDGVVPITCEPASGAPFPLGVATTVACTAVDSRTNSATGSFLVSVVDTTPPALDLPDPITVEATGADGATVAFAVSAVDVVDGDVPVLCDAEPDAAFPIGLTTVACSSTDAAGNAASGSFDIVVVDTTAPTVVVEDITAEASSAAGALVAFSPTASDAVDGPLTPTCDASPGTFPLGDTTVHCTATDQDGNVGFGNFTISVVDTTPPVLGVPADLPLEATGPGGAIGTFDALASDAVDPDPVVTCTPASGSLFALGSTEVSCTATDDDANVAGPLTFTVTVADTTAPIVSLTAPAAVEATSADGAVVDYAASASDAVDGALDAACTPASGSTFALGATDITCTATDAHGNAGSATASVTVEDTAAPAIVIDVVSPVDATGPDGAVVVYTPTATDAVGVVGDVTCSPPSGSVFPLGSTVIECTASDAAGNPGAASATVLVEDVSGPVVTISVSSPVEATGPGGAAVDYTASATDAVDGPVPVDCTPATASTFALGTTTIGCTASDSLGNPGAATADVQVVDATPPVVTIDAPSVVEATSAAGAAVTYAATADDIVDGAFGATCDPPGGSEFGFGAHTILCSATDAAGNLGTASATFEIVDGAPHLTLPSDIVAEATSADGAAVSYVASADDLLEGPVPIDCQPASDSVFALGATAVACSATDGAGHTATGNFLVTIVDTTPPTIAPQGDLAVEATSPAGAIADFAVATSDLVDGDAVADCTPASGAQFPLGATAVTCAATDAAGNAAAPVGFNLIVADTLPPTATIQLSGTEGFAGFFRSAVSVALICSDATEAVLSSELAVDGLPQASPFEVAAEGAHTATGSCVFDPSGTLDATPATFQIDTVPPTLDAHPDVTVEATALLTPVTFDLPLASDGGSGAGPVACEPASGSGFPVGTTVVTCSVADLAGNAVSTAFSVIVLDTTVPVLTLPADIVVEPRNATKRGAVVDFAADVSALDFVDGALPVTCGPPSGSRFPAGLNTVTCWAVDSSGNNATGSFTIRVPAKHGGGGDPLVEEQQEILPPPPPAPAPSPPSAGEPLQQTSATGLPAHIVPQSPAPSSFTQLRQPTITASFGGAGGVDTAHTTVLLDGQPMANAVVLANGVMATPSQPLEDGTHTVEIRTIGGDGKPTSVSWSFVVDTAAPHVLRVDPADGASAGAVLTVLASFTDPLSGVDLATVKLFLDGLPVAAHVGAGEVSYSLAQPLDPGRHTAEVRLSDAAGNQAAQAWSFTVASAEAGMPWGLLALLAIAIVVVGAVLFRGHGGRAPPPPPPEGGDLGAFQPAPLAPEAATAPTPPADAPPAGEPAPPGGDWPR